MFPNKSTRLITNCLNTAYSISNNRFVTLCLRNVKINCGFLLNDSSCHNKRILQRLYSKSEPVNSNIICVSNILNKWKKKFEENAIFEPNESIQYILCHHLHIEKISDLYKKEWLDYNLTQNDVNHINSMSKKRLQSCPIQYILEEWTFRDLTLNMKPPVFIPRPETEELVDIVKDDILLTNVRNILEICCGSGAICLSLLNEIPNISVLALDKSEEACSLTIENAEKYNISDRVTVVQHDIALDEKNISLFAGKQDYYDIIVSNPPYVLTGDMKGLQPEIALYEDLAALDGGLDGMDIIKLILRLSSNILCPGGRLYLEVDPSHPDIIGRLLDSNPQDTTDLTAIPTKHCKQDGQIAINYHGGIQEFSELGLKIRNIHVDFNHKKRFIEIIKIV